MDMERKGIMCTIEQKPVYRPSWENAFIALFLLTAVFVFAWIIPVSGAPLQSLFSSPEDALKSLTDAVKTKDKAALDQIFGPSGEELRSGDRVQDAAEFEELAKHLVEKTSLVKDGDSKVILHIGAADQYSCEFIFPDPAVQYFFLTCLRIKEPLIIFFYKGNRKGPVLVSYVKDHF